MCIESVKTITKLTDYLSDHHVVSIIGIAKNAGKTTALNQIIEEYKTKPIAITSIGLDGEKIDNVTMKEKPRIKLYKNMMVATALNCLDESTIEYVIHEKTNINTPLGVIVIAEVTKEGLVLVAGPSTNKDMKHIVNLFKKYNLERVLIDGALFRKSIANTYLSDAIILSTGASYHSNMSKTVEDTKIFIDQLQLNEYTSEKSAYVRNCETTTFFNENNDETFEIQGSLLHDEYILEEFIPKYSCLYLKGALTDNIFRILVKNRNEFEDFKIIVKDATNILMEPSNFRKLSKMNVSVGVLNQIEILFVTYNPYSPFGYVYDNEKFRSELERNINNRIINVLTDLE